MNIKRLRKKYEFIVNEYIKIFCNKQDLIFEFWIGDKIGGTGCFGDILYFNFQDIIWDINTHQPKGQIVNWMYESIDNPEKTINYFSYSKGLRFPDIKQDLI